MSYPALSKQKYLKNLLKQDLSFSEKIHEKILWLPSSVDLDEKSISRIVKVINKYESRSKITSWLWRYLPGYIHIDINKFDHVDFISSVDDLNMYENDTVDEIYAHLLEYFDK